MIALLIRLGIASLGGLRRRSLSFQAPHARMKLAERLKTGQYRPLPVKRVYIPKTGSKTKTRPLGILSIEDRIVQQALRMALEPIFEADFLSCSHGFRQGHSTHTALGDVVRTYPSASYIIEGDIEGLS